MFLLWVFCFACPVSLCAPASSTLPPCVFSQWHFYCPPMADKTDLSCFYWQSTLLGLLFNAKRILLIQWSLAFIYCYLMTIFVCVFLIVSFLFSFRLCGGPQSALPLPRPCFFLWFLIQACWLCLLLLLCCSCFFRMSSSVSVSSFGCTLRIVTSIFMDYFCWTLFSVNKDLV